LIMITDTLSGKKEVFTPLREGEVSMYVCGPTVYNLLHIGNARPAVVFDSFRRFLEFRGFRVRMVQNFTDIDDKIINRMSEEKWDYETLTATFIREYRRDMDALGVRPPNFAPRTSHFLPQTISFIARLLEQGFAYEVDGEVFFDVLSFASYGALSHRKLEEMQAGSRVGVREQKKNPADFSLWKPAKEGEPSWESPWSRGRPGWHIECSVMATELLGESFDIHAGGNDLIFPHHENERAQSEALSNKPFARYWMHNGMFQVNGAKMAKSVGNIVSIREAVHRFGRDAVRLFIFSTHYRSPIDYSEEHFENWAKAAGRVADCLERISEAFQGDVPFQKGFSPWMQPKMELFSEALEDDFNTPKVLSLIFDTVRELNATEDRQILQQGYSLIRDVFGDVLGLFQLKKASGRREEALHQALDGVVRLLLEQREQYRNQKDFSRADAIRDSLREKGILIKDHPGGSSWDVE